MKKLFIITTLLLSITMPNVSFANAGLANCESSFQEIESLSKCYDNLIERLNRDLNTWVNNQEYMLNDLAKSTGRNAALTVFKRSQKNFLSYRENNCRWYYLAKMPEKNATNLYKRCLITSTSARIDELMEYSVVN